MTGKPQGKASSSFEGSFSTERIQNAAKKNLKGL
jgi:hypothetical protein